MIDIYIYIYSASKWDDFGRLVLSKHVYMPVLGILNKIPDVQKIQAEAEFLGRDNLGGSHFILGSFLINVDP